VHTRIQPKSFLLFILLLSNVSHAELTLRILTWQGYTPKTMLEQFKAEIKQKYNEDLTFEIRYVSHSDEFFENIRNETVDIIAPSHNIIHDERYQLIPERLLLPINLKNIPNYKDLIPALQFAPYTTAKNKVYSVPMLHGPYGLIYDTDKVSKAPSSWKILWSEEYKNRYAISYDYLEANVYITALALGVPKDKLTDISTLQAYDVASELEDLVKNSNNMWRGVDTPEDLKDNAIATSWGFSLPQLKALKKDWKMADMKEGVTGWVDGYALTKNLVGKPKLKLIAEEWINFCISKQVQLEVVVKRLGSAPVNISIADALTAEQLQQSHFDDLEYFEKQRILWPLLTRRQRNYFKGMWDNALESSEK
jgi:spermidine/putrescine transport system substrate-binding protein